MSRRSKIAASIFAAAALLVGGIMVAGQHPLATSPPKPNIVFILTDDQIDTGNLSYMNNVYTQLAAHGVTFDNAFVSNSLCCPSRSTDLTGKTSGHNGVWTNNDTYGGFSAFKNTNSGYNTTHQIFQQLHSNGYATALAGKFLNGYNSPAYKLPGVDKWKVQLLNSTLAQCPKDGYNNGCYSADGTFTETVGYATTQITKAITNWIPSIPINQPVFAWVAYHAPHTPRTVQTGYGATCGSYNYSHPASYNASITNGPGYIVNANPLSNTQLSNMDTDYKKECKTLQSVDDGVGSIIQTLLDTGRFYNTVFVFTSDNGYEYGQHKWVGKTVPYEESINVPLVVTDMREDHGANRHESTMVSNLDLYATFMDAAGLDPTGTDGQSLFPMVDSGYGSYNSHDILLEHLPGAGGLYDAPAYCGVRTSQYMFAHYKNGAEELYDLNADPLEMNNLAVNPSYTTTLNSLRTETQTMCDPPPPGFSW